jgi:hypothetical protein
VQGHGQKYGRKAGALIAALLGEPTYADAARRVGINEATLYRWLARPDFQAAYRAARRRVVEVAVSRLCQLTTQAVATLERNLTCGKAPAEIRAALGVLDNVRALLEGEELEARIAALEERLAAEGPASRRPGTPGGADRGGR